MVNADTNAKTNANAYKEPAWMKPRPSHIQYANSSGVMHLQPQPQRAKIDPRFSRPVYMNTQGAMHNSLTQSGGKKKKKKKKAEIIGKHKLYTGKRGGQYYLRKGRKIYV